MSAETLREAARLMRNRAHGADAGPWKWAEQTHGKWYGLQSQFAALGNIFDPGNAFYIAAMHPAVALAVADWLDSEAEYVETGIHSITFDGSPMFPARPQALAVAAAYLSA